MRRGVLAGVTVFVVSLFVHFLWEALQSFGYGLHGSGPYSSILICLRATVADAADMVAFYGIGWAILRSPVWIAHPGRRGRLLTWALGLAVGIGVEWHALATGRWSYTPAMPLIPGLGVGLLPVLQMLLLPTLIFWVAARLARLR